MSNFALRLLTAFVAGSISIIAIVWSSYGLMLFGAIVSVMGIWEFMALAGESARYRFIAAGFVLLAWGLLILKQAWMPFPLPHIPHLSWEQLLLLAGLLVLPIAATVTLFDNTETNAVQTLATLVMGMLYCAIPMLLLYQLGFRQGFVVHQASGPQFTGTYTYEIPLSVLFLNWFLDSFAYLGGRAFGQHLLYPRISPKKTWEGSVFGALVCVGLGYGLNHYGVAGINWIPVALIISVVSQLGDLIESMMKRNVALKDSGNLLPGHGGMLDRFDGIFISTPVVYLWLTLVV